MRYIGKRETSRIDAKMFYAEKRHEIRRLANLGILGHQPAIAAYCQVDAQERDTIVRSILLQKAASTTNIVDAIIDHRKRINDNLENGCEANAGDNKHGRCAEGTPVVDVLAQIPAVPEDTIKIRRTRFAMNHTVRWRRNKTASDSNGMQVQQEENNDATTVAYTSRILKCNRCGKGRETSWMQLRTNKGYRPYLAPVPSALCRSPPPQVCSQDGEQEQQEETR